MDNSYLSEDKLKHVEEQAVYQHWLRIAQDIVVSRDGKQIALPSELQEQLAKVLASSEPMTYQEWNELFTKLWENDPRVPYLRHELVVARNGVYETLPTELAPKKALAAKALWDKFRIIRNSTNIIHTVYPP